VENYYEILGLSRKPGKEELVFGYLKLACAHHPLHETATADTNERFRLIGEAFCVLYDTKMRFGYDKHLVADPRNELARRVPVPPAQAESLFREMVQQYVVAQLGDDDDPEELVQELLAMKCPEVIADASVRKVYEKVRASILKAGFSMLFMGFLIMLPGLAITLYSMSISRTGVFWLWYGPIVIGGVFVVYALICLVTGRRPARVNPIEFFLGVDQRP
jgi:DnaJ domain